MTNQEIIDAIDAEIEARLDAVEKLQVNKNAGDEIVILLAFAAGLRIARDLVEKAKEVES